MNAFCEHEGIAWDESKLESIFLEVRDAVYDGMRLKGKTQYAIATGLVRIVEAILRNENSILTVSTVVEHYGIPQVGLSLPTCINRKGAEWILHLPLSDQELSCLIRSAETVASAIASLNLDAPDHGESEPAGASRDPKG